MNTLTKLTSQIGNVLAEIRQRNQLIEEAQKLSNPTFVDIITDLEKEDRTLCNMLLLWYCQKYLENPIDIEELFDKIKVVTKTKTPSYSYEPDDCCGGCDGYRNERC